MFLQFLSVLPQGKSFLSETLVLMGYIGPGLFFSSFRLNDTIKHIFVGYGVQKTVLVLSLKS